MRIGRLHVENFRSYRVVDVQLGAFNILLGQNASGKSSFVDILKFLRDISHNGLDNAISMSGGTEFLRNLCTDTAEPMRVSASVEGKYVLPLMPVKEGRRRIERMLTASEAIFDFEIQFNKRGDGFRVLSDKATYPCALYHQRRINNKWVEDPEPVAKGRFVASVRRGKIHFEVEQTQGQFPLLDDLESYWFLRRRIASRDALMLQLGSTPFWTDVPGPSSIFDVAVYDFDVKLPKRAVPATGRLQLEEDGSNLAIVVQRIVRDRESRRRFINLCQLLLPFVQGVDVERVAGRSFMLRLRESFAAKKSIPATFLSDGTISMLALIVAIHFQSRPIVVLEEPERNIHPSLMSRVLSMLREASTGKQILLTTHNPEIVRHAELSEILLASRGSDGCSSISRPGEDSEVRTFLENEVGLDEVFIDDLWGEV